MCIRDRVMDVESAHRAAKASGEKGIENVVITLGKDGAYVLSLIHI